MSAKSRDAVVRVAMRWFDRQLQGATAEAFRQADADLYRACREHDCEVHASERSDTERDDNLRELLRIEYLRHNHLELPWDCIEADCPRFGKSLYLTGCNCVLDFQRKHIAQVKKALGL